MFRRSWRQLQPPFGLFPLRQQLRGLVLDATAKQTESSWAVFKINPPPETLTAVAGHPDEAAGEIAVCVSRGVWTGGLVPTGDKALLQPACYKTKVEQQWQS